MHRKWKEESGNSRTNLLALPKPPWISRQRVSLLLPIIPLMFLVGYSYSYSVVASLWIVASMIWKWEYVQADAVDAMIYGWFFQVAGGMGYNSKGHPLPLLLCTCRFIMFHTPTKKSLARLRRDCSMAHSWISSLLCLPKSDQYLFSSLHYQKWRGSWNPEQWWHDLIQFNIALWAVMHF